jgi:alkylation response protein AidB-like acyl-CoA dehydrogenase
LHAFGGLSDATDQFGQAVGVGFLNDGAGGLVIDDDLAEAYAMFQAALLSSPSSRIAGGSDEILRNIIAERVLGMPSDIRVDKGKPFNQVPTGRR